MKKALILSAIAATVAAPAFAQSSVTVYGRLNVAVESRKIDGTRDKGVFNSASRFGFKGTEDLGGGLKAGFQIESGFDPASGKAATNFWGRQSEVNLSGAFGTVRLGNFTSEAYFATADYVSMHNHDTGISSDALYVDATWAANNKIAYRTPNMGGLTAELAVNESGKNGTNARGYDFATNYDAGAFHGGLGFSKAGSAKQFALRGLYEMGALTVGGYLQRDTGITSAGSRTNLRLAGAYAMGATELHLNVGKAGNTGGISSSGATQVTLGVNQNLSKRTKVYGFVTKVNAQTNAPYSDVDSVAVGVRHNF